MSDTHYTFQVDGMHCGSCALLIDDVLADLDGVVTSDTSVKAGRALVRLDASNCTTDDVIAAIADAGYPARLLD